MAHAGTTTGLGRTRPTTNESQKRPGWTRPALTGILGIALGLAVGTAAWTIAGSQSASTSTKATSAAALHEKIEAHQAAVVAGADRAFDPIEAHRTSVANAAGVSGYDQIEAHRVAAANAVAQAGFDQIESHRISVANAALADHRLDAIETQGGIPVVTSKSRAFSQGVVTLPTESSVKDLLVRRGYDPMPFAAGTNLHGRAYSGGVVLQVAQPPVATPRDRRAYDPIVFAAGTNLHGRAYSGGIVLQAAQPSVTDLSVRRGYDSVAMAVSKSPVRGYSTSNVTQDGIPVSAVDVADPADTPWGPRAAAAANGAGPLDTPWGPWYPR